MQADGSTIVVLVAGTVLACYWDHMALYLVTKEKFFMFVMILSVAIVTMSWVLHPALGLLQRIDFVAIKRKLLGEKKIQHKNNNNNNNNNKNISPYKPYTEVRRLLEDIPVFAKVEVLINGKTGYYEGTWNNGIKKGHGMLKINGQTYVGEWDNNRVITKDGVCHDLDPSVISNMVTTITPPHTQYPDIDTTPNNNTIETTSETPNNDVKRNLDNIFAEEGLSIRAILYISETNSYDDRFLSPKDSAPQKMHVGMLKERIINEIQKIGHYRNKKYTFYFKDRELYMNQMTIELQPNDVILVVVDETVSIENNNVEYESDIQEQKQNYDAWNQFTWHFKRDFSGRLIYRDLYERLDIDPNEERYLMDDYDKHKSKVTSRCLEQKAKCDNEYHQGQEQKRGQLVQELLYLHDKLNHVTRPFWNYNNRSLSVYALDSEDEYEERYINMKNNELYTQIKDKAFEMKSRENDQRLQGIKHLREARESLEVQLLQVMANRDGPNYKNMLINNKNEVASVRDIYLSLSTQKKETQSYISRLDEWIKKIDAALEEYEAMANKLPGMEYWEEWEKSPDQTFDEYSDKGFCVQIIEEIPVVFTVSVIKDAKVVNCVKSVVRKLMELRDYIAQYSESGDDRMRDVYERVLKWFVFNILKKIFLQLENNECNDVQVKVCFLLVYNIMIENNAVDVLKLVKGCIEGKKYNEKIAGLFALLSTSAVYNSPIEEVYSVKDAYRWLKAILDASFKIEVTDKAVENFLFYAGKSIRLQWPNDSLLQEIKDKFQSSDVVQDVLNRLQQDSPEFPSVMFDDLKPFQLYRQMSVWTRGITGKEVEGFVVSGELEGFLNVDNSSILHENTMLQKFIPTAFQNIAQAEKMHKCYIDALRRCRANPTVSVKRMAYLRYKISDVIIESVTQDLPTAVMDLKYIDFMYYICGTSHKLHGDKAFRIQLKAKLLLECPSLRGDFERSEIISETRMIATKETRLIQLYTSLIVYGLEKSDSQRLSFTVDDGWHTLAHVVNTFGAKPKEDGKKLIKKIVKFLEFFMGPESDRNWIIRCASRYPKYKPHFRRVVKLLRDDMAKGGSSRLYESNENGKTESFLRLEKLLGYLQSSL